MRDIFNLYCNFAKGTTERAQGTLAIAIGAYEDEQSILFETSRQNRLFSPEPTLIPKEIYTRGCTRKFTIHL